jgi:uncharacterized protein (DUF58 family)
MAFAGALVGIILWLYLPRVNLGYPHQEDILVDEEPFKKIREIKFRAGRVVNSVFSGEYHSIFKGRGMEFAEVRPYQPGDDIRSMDWKVTARTGEPFIKIFSEERELVLILLVDFSASGHFGSGDIFKSELAAELCGALALSAIKNNDKVGLLAFTDRIELFIPPKKGRSHVLRLIRELLYFKPEGSGTDIASALDYLNSVMGRRSIVFLVSDFRSGVYEKQLKATARKHDLIAIRVYDPVEREVPRSGLINIKDGETGEVITVDTSNSELRDEYKTTFDAELAVISRMFRTAGVDEIMVDTSQSYVEPVIRFFKKRERRLGYGR